MLFKHRKSTEDPSSSSPSTPALPSSHSQGSISYHRSRVTLELNFSQPPSLFQVAENLPCSPPPPASSTCFKLEFKDIKKKKISCYLVGVTKERAAPAPYSQRGHRNRETTPSSLPDQRLGERNLRAQTNFEGLGTPLITLGEIWLPFYKLLEGSKALEGQVPWWMLPGPNSSFKPPRPGEI